MKYARVTDGIAVEVITVPSDLIVKENAEDIGRPVTITDMFTADFVAELTECPDEVEAGWLYAAGQFSAPPSI